MPGNGERVAGVNAAMACALDGADRALPALCELLIGWLG
jgi:hypothetical protein